MAPLKTMDSQGLLPTPQMKNCMKSCRLSSLYPFSLPLTHILFILSSLQSYGADENFAAVVSSPQRRLSRRSFRRSGRRRHGSGSESDGESMLGKQVSLDQQVSVMSDGGFHGSTADLRKTTSKKQEEWDKDIPKVS